MKFNVIFFLLTNVHNALNIEYTSFIYIMFSTILQTVDVIIHYVSYVFILLNNYEIQIFIFQIETVNWLKFNHCKAAAKKLFKNGFPNIISYRLVQKKTRYI